MIRGETSQKLVTQVNSPLKLWHLMLSMIVAMLIIISFVAATMDARVDAHDGSASTHPDMRSMIESNQETIQELRDISITQTLMLKGIAEDVKEIKAGQ